MKGKRRDIVLEDNLFVEKLSDVLYMGIKCVFTSTVLTGLSQNASDLKFIMVNEWDIMNPNQT